MSEISMDARLYLWLPPLATNIVVLLTQGADVDVRRPYDQRNAIDLARDSSLIELEEQLRRDYSKEQQHSFGSF